MTAVGSALTWRVADVADSVPMTARAHLVRLRVEGWRGSAAGQHVDIRLTSADGYQATRSYSLASVGESDGIELLVARVEGGEVSTFVNDELRAGDQLEVLGPLGRWFVWPPAGKPEDRERPVVLIAGGSGVVPIVSILRARQALRSRHEPGGDDPMRLLYSVRSPDDVLFAADLAAARADGVDMRFAYTRAAPEGEPLGRVDRDRLLAFAGNADEHPLLYVCGTTAFVEAVLTWLTAAGHRAEDIRPERFGG